MLENEIAKTHQFAGETDLNNRKESIDLGFIGIDDNPNEDYAKIEPKATQISRKNTLLSDKTNIMKTIYTGGSEEQSKKNKKRCVHMLVLSK